MIKKVGKMWAVVHAHPKKRGSKRDKPKGTVIKKFKTKKAAYKMHRAIASSQARRKKR